MSKGKAFLRPNIQSLLLAGLLALTSQAFGQTDSFVIECKVSGEFLGTTDSKITNQLIKVSVDSKGAEATVRIEGSGHLNIGIIRDKPVIFNKEEILLLAESKTNIANTLSNVSINRATGFIDIFISTSRLRGKLMDMTTASGFCTKVSNKPKF